MRHVIFPRPVAPGSRRVIDPAPAARLVPPTGFALRPPPRLPGAVGAVHVAAITMAADQHLGATALAPEQSGGKAAAAGTIGAVTRRRRGGRPWTHFP